MSNSIQTVDLVANAILSEFVNNNSLLLTGARTYEQDFQMEDYQVGDSLRIRKQNVFNVSDGRISTPQDVIEEVETLKIAHQFNSEINYTSKELTLFVNTGQGPFNERYIRPLVQEITKKMEETIATQAISEIYNYAGSPGTPINSFAAVDIISAQMQELGMPVFPNSYMALTPRDASALKSVLQNSFNPTLNEDISFYSSLGHLSIFDIFSNQSLKRFSAGNLTGTPLVNGAVSSGNTIVIDGLGGGSVLNVGDILTFGTFGASSAVNSVNPIGRQDTGQLASFVVTQAAVEAGSSITAVVNPAIISDVANPRRNVSQAIPDNAPVALVGSTLTYNNNLAYTDRGLDIVIPPLAKLSNVEASVVTDKDVNVSIRVQRDGDIRNDINVLRVDVLCGFKWHPQYAVRVLS